MTFKIGDNVAVLDDIIKGKVIKVFTNKIVIETEDGFPFDFLPKELVVIKESQRELSKFSDISNESLLEKINHTSSKKNIPKFKTANLNDKRPPMEVDLHIHHLTKSTRGMDNYDMLNLQINEAKFKLEFAIKNKISKVVFIHGVGQGVLKTELAYLFNNYHVKWYEASFQKYGLGATEVYIYKNAKGS
ncbi:MAG: DNA mismatch repair protein MutS [Lutibacter sp.]|uniref:DNA mismatch repair protein MutS n=1 Tax=Lutibacter sp. TaxID=1925666 RepID=UPI001A0E5599|nr:DNA mismatch repair protein MutS [Lutibacter sp.]NOR29271.1 DNA mismatch repair protein MutS [Lutibacter sp.]